MSEHPEHDMQEPKAGAEDENLQSLNLLINEKQTLMVSENPSVRLIDSGSDNSYLLNQLSPRSLPFSKRTLPNQDKSNQKSRYLNQRRSDSYVPQEAKPQAAPSDQEYHQLVRVFEKELSEREQVNGNLVYGDRLKLKKTIKKQIKTTNMESAKKRQTSFIRKNKEGSKSHHKVPFSPVRGLDSAKKQEAPQNFFLRNLRSSQEKNQVPRGQPSNRQGQDDPANEEELAESPTRQGIGDEGKEKQLPMERSEHKPKSAMKDRNPVSKHVELNNLKINFYSPTGRNKLIKGPQPNSQKLQSSCMSGSQSTTSKLKPQVIRNPRIIKNQNKTPTTRQGYQIRQNQIDLNPTSLLNNYMQIASKDKCHHPGLKMSKNSPLPQKFEADRTLNLQNFAKTEAQIHQSKRPLNSTQQFPRKSNPLNQTVSSNLPSFVTTQKQPSLIGKPRQAARSMIDKKSPQKPAMDRKERIRRQMESANRLYNDALKRQQMRKMAAKIEDDEVSAPSSSPKKERVSKKPEIMRTQESALGSRKVSVESLGLVAKSSHGILPQSQGILSRLFREEFWPVAQKVLQKEHNAQFLTMLDVYDLQYCEKWKQDQDFLFKDTEFKQMPQEEQRALKERVKAVKKSEELIVRMENVELIMMGLGFLTDDKIKINMDDKLEFMRFWDCLIKMQQKEEEKDAQKQLKIATFKNAKDMTESIESSLNILNQHFENASRKSMNSNGRSQINNIDSITSRRSQQEDKLADKLGLQKGSEVNYGGIDMSYLVPAEQQKEDEDEPLSSARVRKLSADASCRQNGLNTILHQSKSSPIVKGRNEAQNLLSDRAKSQTFLSSKASPSKNSALKTRDNRSDLDGSQTDQQQKSQVRSYKSSDLQQTKILKGIKVKVVIDALLNVEGIIKNNPTIFYKFRRLKDNRDEHVARKRQEAKRINSTKKEIMRKKKENETASLQRLREERDQVAAKKGYFGQNEDKKLIQKSEKYLQESERYVANPKAQQQFFMNNLRVYVSPSSSAKKPKRESTNRNSHDAKPPMLKMNSPRGYDVSRNEQHSYSMMGMSKKLNSSQNSSMKNLRSKIIQQSHESLVNGTNNEMKRVEMSSISQNSDLRSRRPQSDVKNNFPMADRHYSGSKHDENSKKGNTSLELTDRSNPVRGSQIDFIGPDKLRIKANISSFVQSREATPVGPIHLGSNLNTSLVFSNQQTEPNERRQKSIQKTAPDFRDNELSHSQQNESMIFSQPEHQMDGLYPQSSKKQILEIQLLSDSRPSHILDRSNETMKTPQMDSFQQQTFSDQNFKSQGTKKQQRLDQIKYAVSPKTSENLREVPRSVSKTKPKFIKQHSESKRPPQYTPNQKRLVSPASKDKSKSVSKKPKQGCRVRSKKPSAVKPNPVNLIIKHRRSDSAKKKPSNMLAAFNNLEESKEHLSNQCDVTATVPYASESSNYTKLTDAVRGQSNSSIDIEEISESEIDEKIKIIESQYKLIKKAEKQMKSQSPVKRVTQLVKQQNIFEYQDDQRHTDSWNLSQQQFEEAPEFYKQLRQLHNAEVQTSNDIFDEVLRRREGSGSSVPPLQTSNEESKALDTLREQIRIQASNQNRNKTLLNYNAEVIKEAFREDSLASSSEEFISGMLRTQNSNINSSQKGLGSSTEKRFQKQSSFEDWKRQGSLNTDENKSEIQKLKEEALAFVGNSRADQGVFGRADLVKKQSLVTPKDSKSLRTDSEYSSFGNQQQAVEPFDPINHSAPIHTRVRSIGAINRIADHQLELGDAHVQPSSHKQSVGNSPRRQSERKKSSHTRRQDQQSSFKSRKSPAPASELKSTSTKEAQKVFALPGLFNDDEDSSARNQDPKVDERAQFEKELEQRGQALQAQFFEEEKQSTEEKLAAQTLSPRSFNNTSIYSQSSTGRAKKFVSKFASKHLVPRDQSPLISPRGGDVANSRRSEEKQQATPNKYSLNNSMANIHTFQSPGTMSIGHAGTPLHHQGSQLQETPNFFGPEMTSQRRPGYPYSQPLSTQNDQEEGYTHFNTASFNDDGSNTALNSRRGYKVPQKIYVSDNQQLECIIRQQGSPEEPLSSQRMRVTSPDQEKQGEKKNQMYSSPMDLPLQMESMHSFSHHPVYPEASSSISYHNPVMFMTSDNREMVQSSRNTESDHPVMESGNNHTFGRSYHPKTANFSYQESQIYHQPIQIRASPQTSLHATSYQAYYPPFTPSQGPLLPSHGNSQQVYLQPGQQMVPVTFISSQFQTQSPQSSNFSSIGTPYQRHQVPYTKTTQKKPPSSKKKQISKQKSPSPKKGQSKISSSKNKSSSNSNFETSQEIQATFPESSHFSPPMLRMFPSGPGSHLRSYQQLVLSPDNVRPFVVNPTQPQKYPLSKQ